MREARAIEASDNKNIQLAQVITEVRELNNGRNHTACQTNISFLDLCAVYSLHELTIVTSCHGGISTAKSRSRSFLYSLIKLIDAMATQTENEAFSTPSLPIYAPPPGAQDRTQTTFTRHLHQLPQPPRLPPPRSLPRRGPPSPHHPRSPPSAMHPTQGRGPRHLREHQST